MKTYLKLAVHIFIIFCCCSKSFGAIVTATSTIKNMSTYSTFGSGNVIFSLNTSIAGCSKDLWLRKSDPGFNGYLSFLLSAFHANSTISIAARDDDLWNGDTGYCRVDWITLNSG